MPNLRTFDPSTPLSFDDRTVIVDRSLGRGEICDHYLCRYDKGSARSTSGRTRYDRIFDESETHVVLKVASNATDNDLVRNEIDILRHLVPEGSPEEKFYRYLPRVLESTDLLIRGREHAAFVLPYFEGYVSLAEIAKAFPEGLDFRDVAWMTKRILAGLWFAHERGYVHGGILPPHVLVHPTGHGAKIVGWSYATRRGQRVKAMSRLYAGYCAPEIPGKVGAGPSTDCFMLASCAALLLGGDPSSGAMPDTVPGEVRDFFQRCRAHDFSARPRDAGELHEEFDNLLRTLVGPPTYRPLVMPKTLLVGRVLGRSHMTQPSDIKWGKYLHYQGPHFPGTIPYIFPDNPSWEDKLLATVTATEGARIDGYNGYDRMIVSVGVIQFAEAGQYSVSDLLGAVAKAGVLGDSLDQALAASNAAFKPNARGRWRFHFLDERGEVDRIEEQRQLFLLDSDGVHWDDASKAHAKLWAASIVNVWSSTEAQRIQIAYTLPRLLGFVTSSAKAILFGPGAPKENEGWAGALRAGYVSFAANIPAVASKMLGQAVAKTTAPAWSRDWCLDVLRELTFGPKIAIYPHRYEKIRPVLERVFGVDLPDFANELERWRTEIRADEGSPMDTTADIQRALIRLGFDLGPSGADGVMGRLTKEAVVQFQAQNGLEPDGIVGKKTRSALVRSSA